MANFAKPSAPRFSVEVYQNEFLAEGARDVHAIVTVTSTGGATATRTSVAPGGAAVVIMVDCSGSMEYPPEKMRGAREATAAAVDTLRDGTAFAVIAGTHVAKEVFPRRGRLAIADATTRAQAKEALRGLSSGGGTAIGTWLRLADGLLRGSTAAIRHGILLTDGRNEHEDPAVLRATLDACAGRFTCDARGVGTDWEVKEVTGIASALLGTADIVADPARLTEDFTHMMEKVMGKEVADVSLRLWTPVGAEVLYVKQVAPAVQDLTGRRTEATPRAGDYPTGSWGDESREYHVCVRVPGASVGQEMLAARAALLMPGRPARTRPSWLKAWSAPSGRTISPRPPPSTRRWPTTPGRRSSRRPSSRVWRPANWETSAGPRPSSAGPCSWRAPRATPTPPSCSPRWWMSSMRRRVLCD